MGIEKNERWFLAMMMAFFVLVNSGKMNLDDYHRLVGAVMVVTEGRFDLDPRFLPDAGYLYYTSEYGKLFVHWGLFSHLVYVPVVIVGEVAKAIFPFVVSLEQAMGKSLLVERFVGSLVIMPLVMLLNVILLQRVLRNIMGITAGRSLYGLSLLAFGGTQLLVYSSGYEEGVMVLFFLAAVLVGEGVHSETKKGVILGILAGCAFNCRHYIGLPVFTLFILWELYKARNPRLFIVACAVSLIPYIIIFFLYNFVRYDSFSPDIFFQYYVSHDIVAPNLFRNSWSEIAYFFWDRSLGAKGLFVFSPVLLLAPLGLWTVIRHRCIDSPITRLMVVSCGVVFCYFFVHAVLAWGSADIASWGPRYMTACIPFLFFMAVPAIQRLWALRKATGVKRLFFIALVGLSITSCLIQVISVLGWEETDFQKRTPGPQILQRVQNLWDVSTNGKPLAPHHNEERPLFTGRIVSDRTNKDGSFKPVFVKMAPIYEGLALWPVTLGAALGLLTWQVISMLLVNLSMVIVFGLLWIRDRTLNPDSIPRRP